MIVNRIIRQGLLFGKSKQLLKFNKLVQTCKVQNNNKGSFVTNVQYCFSQKKSHSRKKSLGQNHSYVTSKSPADINTFSKSEQLSSLKQGVNELIENRQDDSYMMDVLQTYSNLLIHQHKLKDGIIEFEEIVKKMKSISVFKASPNFHFALCELRYYYIRTGRIEQAIGIAQQSLRLLKKASQKQSLHVGSQLSTMGILLFMNKNLVEARYYLQKEEKVNQKLCDQTYIEYIDCKNNLAIIDFAEGKYEQAQNSFQKNVQVTTRILKSTKKGKQKLYAKHFTYLEAIYQIKLANSTSEEQKNQYKQKIHQCNQEIRQILKDNNKAVNDLSLYYETIAHYLLKKNNQISIKFIKKAIAINQNKLDKPHVDEKTNRTPFEVSNIISKDLKLLAQAYQDQKLFKQAQENYLRSINRYKKDFNSLEARQMLSLQNLQNFIECYRLLFELQFVPENQLKQPLEQAIKYLQEPLLVWNEITKNIWNIPARFIFIPYELNIQIGIKLLQHNYVDTALQYFSACIKEILSHKNLLCSHSRRSMGVLAEKIKKAIEKVQNISTQNNKSLKNIHEQLNSLSQS